MPTIKRKVEMILPQLIEWAKNNEIKDRMFLTKDSYCVGFDRHGYIYFNSSLTMPLNQVFTVEVEEEITMDTVLDAIVIVRRQISILGNESTHVCRKGNVSINQVLIQQPNNSQFVYLEIHLMENDRIDRLIWTKEKGLVG